MKRIAVIGDYDPLEISHTSIADSIRHFALKLSEKIDFEWILSDEVNFSGSSLKRYSGLWIAPGSPYRNMHNVLETIRYGREHEIPTLCTCAGFQHMIIEFARNKLGIYDADSQENDINCTNPVISLLKPSLMNQTEKLKIPNKSSRLYKIMDEEVLLGQYRCNYGFNHDFYKVYEGNGLIVAAVNEQNQVRALELENHPFFIGTLFLPQLDFKGKNSYQIIQSFIEALL